MQEGNTSKVQASQKDCASLDPNACVLQVNLCSMRHPLCIALGLTSLLCCVATGADLASTSPFVGAGAGATGAGGAVAPTLHGQPTVVQGIIGQQVPADDAQKIQAIAAEVARRRMLREQDMQKATQDGGAAAPASKGSGRLRAPQN